MNQATPATVRASSQAGLSSFRQTLAPVEAVPAIDPETHEHVWLPVQTDRISTGQNSYTEHRIYKCLCGKRVQ